MKRVLAKSTTSAACINLQGADHPFCKDLLSREQRLLKHSGKKIQLEKAGKTQTSS